MSEQYFDERAVNPEEERSYSITMLPMTTNEKLWDMFLSVSIEETLTEFTQDFFEEAEEAFGDGIDQRIILVYLGKLTKLKSVLDQRLEKDIAYFTKFELLLNQLLREIAPHDEN